MSGLGTLAASATMLLNTDNVNALKDLVQKQLSKGKEQLQTPEGRQEAMDSGVNALKKALDYIRYDAVKDLKTADSGLKTFKDYAYQKTLNSQQAEEIYAAIKGEVTAEQRQRKLEKILYLYLLETGLRMTPSIDINDMTADDRARFFKDILRKNSDSRSAIEEMVRNLLILFFYGRLGISGVQYKTELGDQELQGAYQRIVETERRKVMDEDIEKSVMNGKFLEAFLKDIIEDYENNTANDAKYFGYTDNHLDMIHHRLRNFVNEHNRYVTTYIKSGKGLQAEIDKLDRLDKAISNLEPFINKPGETDAIHATVQNMINALKKMKETGTDGKIRVKQLVSLDELLAGGPVVTGDEIIVEEGRGEKRKADESDDVDEGDIKRMRSGTMGGKSRRKRSKKKTLKKKKRRHLKKRTMRKTRKGGRKSAKKKTRKGRK